MNVRLFVSVFFVTLFAGFTQSHAASNSVACTKEYAPVCGSVQVQCVTSPCNPVRQTFGNSCMAWASNATNITEGACEASPILVGGDRDIHGCIGSAGYTWNASENKCVRPWENPKMSAREALKNGTWIIESLNGKTIKTSATLTFNKNTFNAKVCNTMSGQYGVTSNVLIFRKVISTMMYCDGDIMLVENALQLTRAKFMVGSTNLTITTKKWDVIVWKKQ